MSDLTNTYLGQFRIIEVIWAGEMVTLYRAYQPALDRFVAVKVLPPTSPSFDSKFATHFKLAAQEIAKVHHPNILRIYDYDEQDGLRYLVLQYIEGGASLADMLGRPLELTSVVQLVGQLLDALEYAHQHGVIHGDIKPANIMITSSGWPMLSDFGIVKRINDSQRMELSGEVIGTPQYMAPETATKQGIDSRTDLYAFGVVLYEMLTGRVPFDDANPMDILTKHVHTLPPAPRRFNSTLPAEIEAVVLRALEKDPAARYQSAAEMSKALTLAAEQLPNNSARSQITSFYLSGVQAFAARRWDVAIERFSQVVALDPTYEDVTELLETAQDTQERTKREAQRQLTLARQQQQSSAQSPIQPTPSLSAIPNATRETIQLAPITEPVAESKLSAAASPATTSEAHKAIVRRLIEEVWNKGNIALLDELFANVSATGIEQAVIEWRSTFPDGFVTIEEMIAENDTVMVRWTLRGSQPESLQGMLPDIQPMTVAGISIDRIADGKIVHATNWTIVQQLGVIPSLRRVEK